ncbi:hypothetical protein CHS0354_028200 [Potamilus streckersoni]|uniref:Uncharacterized protein n=1 Tax=Potamilus streckersoni TaxID=2493646 RepID=A0AAE0WE24_9BIVA|nr:hypothetical protein CHS0354_028200 [Potamilus streckersoni]
MMTDEATGMLKREEDIEEEIQTQPTKTLKFTPTSKTDWAKNINLQKIANGKLKEGSEERSVKFTCVMHSAFETMLKSKQMTVFGILYNSHNIIEAIFSKASIVESTDDTYSTLINRVHGKIDILDETATGKPFRTSFDQTYTAASSGQIM